MATPRVGGLCLVRVARSLGPVAALSAVLLAGDARAERPPEGGLWAYAEDDVLSFHDSASGRVRVHYAVQGPSQTLLDDDDEDGVPDFVAEVGSVAEASLDLYAELGFRPPLSEDDLGLGELGGSFALDIYLVDFQGNADGSFGVDACLVDLPHCGGWIGLENDFSGYSYSDRTEAIETVVPHEIFHAVQSAYRGGQPAWFAEGTAVWAQRRFLPDSEDFLGKCDAYLKLSERPIYAPPAGPVQAFSYGTALFWWFLHDELGGALDVDLQVASEASDGTDEGLIDGIDAMLTAAGESTGELWFTFVQYNLATGSRAGALEGHTFSAKLAGIEADSEGPMIDDMARLSPLAASYYRLDHGGGEMAFGLDEPLGGVRFSLHPVVGGAKDGPVEPSMVAWSGDVAGVVPLGERAAGGYWLVASSTEPLAATAKARLCLGPLALVEECAGVDPSEDSETGMTSSSGDDSATDGDDSATTSATDVDGDGTGLDDSEGCACALAGRSPRSMGRLLLPLLVFAGRRRRRDRN